jgi:hypothetical protein
VGISTKDIPKTELNIAIKRMKEEDEGSKKT